MSEPTKISFAEWRKYEWNTIKRARSEINASIFIRGGTSAMITGVLGFFGTYWGGYLGKNEITGRCLVALGAAIIGTALTFAGEFLFRLFRAPAKMEKEAREKSERLENTFNEVIDRNESAHKGHVELLLSQIQTLQTQFDDRVKRKKTEGELGDYHMKLTDRVRAIKAMWYYENGQRRREACGGQARQRQGGGAKHRQGVSANTQKTITFL